MTLALRTNTVTGNEKALTYKERKHANFKKYYENHKEQMCARARKYYWSHKEQSNTHSQEYYCNHRAQILDRGVLWKKEHPDKVRANNRSYLRRLSSREQGHLRKVKALMYYSNPQGSMVCNNCGEQDIDVLCLDHIDGGGSEHRKRDVNAKQLYWWLKKNNYPECLQVLCFNCNVKKSLFER